MRSRSPRVLKPALHGGGLAGSPRAQAGGESAKESGPVSSTSHLGRETNTAWLLKFLCRNSDFVLQKPAASVCVTRRRRGEKRGA